MKLKIAMLLPIHYGPNMRVNPQIGIASYLVNFGHEITWILSAESSRKIQVVAFNGINVFAAPYSHYLSEKYLPGKAVNLVIGAINKLRLTLKVFKERQYDLLFVREDTFDGLVGTYVKSRYKIPLVYELASPLEEEWEGYKIEAKKPLFLWYLMAKIKASLKVYIMKKADLVLPTTRWFEEELVKKGISRTKLMPFPNGVDSESFSNKEGKDVREEYRLGNSRVIIYLGVIGKMRKLDVLFRAFSKVREERWDVKLLMVGDGTARKDLERLATELGVRDEVIFTGQVPQAEVPSFIAAADIGVSIVPPLSFYKVSSPIKALECMVMGKPVVANEEIFEHREVIEQSGGGILVPFTAEAFACAIIEPLDNPEKASEMGGKGYEWVVNNRSYQILGRRIEQAYICLVRGNK